MFYYDFVCLCIKTKQIIENPISYTTSLLLWPLSSPAAAANAYDGNAASNTNKKLREKKFFFFMKQNEMESEVK